VLPLGHGLLVVATVSQQPAVIVDALGNVVIDAERRRGAHRLPVHVLLGRQRHASRWAGALDAEQVVVLGGQLALPPPGLVDGLGDRDGGGNPVTVLRRDGPGRDCVDERLLRAAFGRRLVQG
jgi:hypothetical protein